MAYLVGFLPLSLLFLASSSLLQAHARERLFFSKAARFEAPIESAPAPAPAIGMEGPWTFPPESHNGYGLYGHGLDDDARRSADDLPSGFPSDENSNANNFPSRFPSDEFYGGGYGRREPNTRHSTYTNSNKQYGMSDTRFMQNGRYFYDANAENGYKSTRRDHEGYGSTDGYGGYGYGYGGQRNGYNNAMDSRQEEQGRQEDYVP